MTGSVRRHRMARPQLLIAAALSMAVTLGALLFILWRLANPSAYRGAAAVVDADSWFDGSTDFVPPRPLADFTLTGLDGAPLSLSDLAGRPLLLYFGYTSCPDFCQDTLAGFQRVQAALGADAPNFLLVSVDGETDTPARLREFLGRFDAGFLGMTGAEREVKRIGADFGLQFHDNRDHEQLVDHTVATFLIDGAGVLRTMFTFGTEPQVIAERVAALEPQARARGMRASRLVTTS